MGCCASKVPSFEKASASLAHGVLPGSAPNHTGEFQPIKLVPNQGILSATVAVYLPGDGDISPSYFFNGDMGNFKLFKVVTTSEGETDSQEVVTIYGGMQSSNSSGYNENFSLDSDLQRTHQITNRAEKTCTVKSNHAQVKIKKVYVRNEGNSMQIDSGFEITDDPSSSAGCRCKIVTRHGRIVAYIYEKGIPTPATSMPPSGMSPGFGASMAMGLSYLKSPVGLFVATMSEEDLQLTLSVIATANDRLIRNAMLDVYNESSGPSF